MIKPLTTLRAFFALAVFLSHLSFLKENRIYNKLFVVFFSEGFIGVSFFFILSGFILAYNYQNKFLNKSITYKKYFLARIARIYPLYIATLIFAIPISLSVFYKYIYVHLLLLQSFVPVEGIYFSLNAPSWSISNEMFFYLIFPILLILLSWSRILFIILLLIGLLSVILLNIYLPEGAKHYWLYIFPGIRVVDFLIGIILYQIYNRLAPYYIKIKYPQLLEAGSLFLLIFFFFFKDDVAISYRYSIYYFLPMSLIILCFALSINSENKIGGWLSKLFSHNFFVKAGEISFSFYLWHFLVIIYFQSILNNCGLSVNDELKGLIIFLLTIIISFVTYKYVEKPFNTKIKNF